MIVNTSDCTEYLVETYIVESFETCSGDLSDFVIGDEEFLLPPHKHILAICAVFVMEICGLFGLFSHGSPRRKSCPRFHIFFVACAPVLMTSLEGIFWTNNFAFEARGQCRMLGSQACWISAQMRHWQTFKLAFNF